MTPIQIIGQPGAGKTTLVVALVENFVERGLKVGTLKHSSHTHELDKPGKDSFLHRKAGAAPAAMVTGAMSAIYLPRGEQASPQYLLDHYFKDLDIGLIEGWISGPHPKIEVWRKSVGRPPLLFDIPGVTALVTDDALDPEIQDRMAREKIPCLPRSRVDALADRILAKALETPPHRPLARPSRFRFWEAVGGMAYGPLMNLLFRDKR